MKYGIQIGALLVLLSLSAFGETNQVQVTQQPVLTPKVASPIVVPIPTNQISLIPPRTVTVSGALIQAVKADNPLQLVNPLAPESYGDGFDNLVLDLGTERPLGIAMLSLKF